VTVADMGLHVESLADHDWLIGVDGEAEDPFLPGGEIRPYAFHGLFGAGNVRVTAPEATVFVERDVEIAQASSGATYESDAVLELEGALQRDAKIIVFVFTASTRDAGALMAFDVLYESRIKPRKEELVFLAPAGNEGLIDPQYPAAYPWAISVGALTKDGSARASFSNYGKWVDVYARGEDLVNAFGTGTYTCTEPPTPGAKRNFAGMASWSGTSFSTPLVAGLIATRMSCQGVSAPEAAAALLEFARSQRLGDGEPVIFPGQACCSP
jgi:Subtilase family